MTNPDPVAAKPHFDLGSTLDELGWSRSELAVRLGLSRESVSRWGEEVPRYAVAYLEMALMVRRFALRALGQ